MKPRINLREVPLIVWRNIHHVGALAAIGFMLLSARWIIAPDIANNDGVQNLETPWHVLQTVEALGHTPAHTHWFLPIVTLRPSDRGIPWGATIPDKEGYYYYTSATSPTFVLPYMWFSAFQLKPTIANLADFNFVLQIISVFLAYAFIFDLLRRTGVARTLAATSSTAAVAVLILSREALLAFGIVYWYHGAYLAVLVAALWLLLLTVTTPNDPPRGLLLALAVACFFGAWIDWSGFVFNIGAPGILLLFSPTRRSLQIAAWMAGGTIIAALAILFHYGAVLGFVDTLDAFRHRFHDRNAVAGVGLFRNILRLIQGYALSFGLFLVALLASAILAVRARIEVGAQRLLLMMALVAAVPLAQNIILMENSAEFSYERLKFAVPAAMVIAVALANTNRAGMIILAAMIVASPLIGVWTYREDNVYYSRWKTIDATNKKFQEAVMGRREFGCAALVTNVVTRGYSTLLFGRMIAETYQKDYVGPATEAIAHTGACAAIFLEGASYPPFTDLAEYTAAYIFDPGSGTPRTIHADRPLPDPSTRPLYVRLFSYGARAPDQSLTSYPPQRP